MESNSPPLQGGVRGGGKYPVCHHICHSAVPRGVSYTWRECNRDRHSRAWSRWGGKESDSNLSSRCAIRSSGRAKVGANVFVSRGIPCIRSFISVLTSFRMTITHPSCFEYKSVSPRKGENWIHPLLPAVSRGDKLYAKEGLGVVGGI